jgi:hypothetical protein
MGTFRVKLDALSASTVPLSADGLPPEPILAIFNFNIPPFYTTSPTTAAEYMSVLDNTDLNIGGIFEGTLGNTPVTVDFQTGNAIVLDGDEGNPLTFNGLPAGFKIITAKVVINLEAQLYGVGPTSMDLFLRQGNVGESAAIPIPIDSVVHPYEFPFVDISSALDVITGGCGFRLVPSNVVSSFTYLDITGTYELQRFQFSIETEAPVSVGQDIEITTSEEDLRKVTHIIVDYTTLDNVDHEVDITSFVSQGQFSLVFAMIDFGNAPKVRISLISTEFSGSVDLGEMLTINFLDGTGIYKLDTGATHDTLYVQDYTPFQTIDVKIPNPFAKTAFVP